jgi:pimeloyl-ACP methyl ester carboxylesterase
MSLPDGRRGYPSYRRDGIVPDRPVEPRYAVSRGHRIAYDDVGDGPPIVLLHGVTLSGGDWWETGAVDLLLDAGHRALVVDPLGHGQSDAPHDRETYRYPDVALDVLPVLDAAGVDSATLWGYSRGALLATALAAERPERVSALVVGGAARMEAMPPTELADYQRGMLDGDWNAFWGSALGAEYTPEDRRYAESAFDVGAIAAAMVSRRLFPYPLRLLAVACPVLLYGGSEDDPESAAATAAGLGTNAVVLPGLDHNTAVIEAGRVWTVVRPFLSQVAGG